MNRQLVIAGVVVGAVALATAAPSLTSAGPLDAARDDHSSDSTSHLNRAGQPDLLDLGAHRSANRLGGGVASGETEPPPPPPIDPRNPRFIADTTPELNMVGRPGVVFPARGGVASGETDPPPPPPIDPRNPRFIADTTPELNMVGRPGVVIPDLGKQRAQHPIGGR